VELCSFSYRSPYGIKSVFTDLSDSVEEVTLVTGGPNSPYSAPVPFSSCLATCPPYVLWPPYVQYRPHKWGSMNLVPREQTLSVKSKSFDRDCLWEKYQLSLRHSRSRTLTEWLALNNSGAAVWTQGFMLARQVFYLLSHPVALFLYCYFWVRGSLGLASLVCDPPISMSPSGWDDRHVPAGPAFCEDVGEGSQKLFAWAGFEPWASWVFRITGVSHHAWLGIKICFWNFLWFLGQNYM
jgi:hypothetical protein